MANKKQYNVEWNCEEIESIIMQYQNGSEAMRNKLAVKIYHPFQMIARVNYFKFNKATYFTIQCGSMNDVISIMVAHLFKAIETYKGEGKPNSSYNYFNKSARFFLITKNKQAKRELMRYENVGVDISERYDLKEEIEEETDAIRFQLNKVIDIVQDKFSNRKKMKGSNILMMQEVLEWLRTAPKIEGNSSKGGRVGKQQLIGQIRLKWPEVTLACLARLWKELDEALLEYKQIQRKNDVS